MEYHSPVKKNVIVMCKVSDPAPAPPHTHTQTPLAIATDLDYYLKLADKTPLLEIP